MAEAPESLIAQIKASYAEQWGFMCPTGGRREGSESIREPQAEGARQHREDEASRPSVVEGLGPCDRHPEPLV